MGEPAGPITPGRFKRETEVAVELVSRAALACEQIRRDGLSAAEKPDGTPLTHADIVCQAILLSGLKAHFPRDRIEAEESFSPRENGTLRAAACDTLGQMGFSSSERWLEEQVNYRGRAEGRRIWMVDPIDGTKGFQKGLCYAVAMGLYFQGRPRFGCIAAPLFPTEDGRVGQTVIAYGGSGSGAYWMAEGTQEAERVRVSAVDTLSDLRLVGSRAHDAEDLCTRFATRTGSEQVMRLDGQTKYLMLAAGRADLYLRAARPGYGIAYPWDHCAGQAILEAAGGVVSDFDGHPVNYEPLSGGPIRDANGLAGSNGRCHHEILDVVRKIWK